jgi:predicted nucleotidyltransferase component of viral defense system
VCGQAVQEDVLLFEPKIVSPAPMLKTYPVILSMPAPELRSYTPETVIAEKLQAMIHLGTINSRMKDFHDLWILANRFDFKGKVLQEAIHRTFEHRNTDIPAIQPIALSARFAREKQSQWKAFLMTNTFTDAPDQLELVLECLQKFILPVFRSSHTGLKFGKK